VLHWLEKSRRRIAALGVPSRSLLTPTSLLLACGFLDLAHAASEKANASKTVRDVTIQEMMCLCTSPQSSEQD
jgi:hypothetical protein